MKYLTPLPGKAVEPPPLDQEALGTSSDMAGHPAAEWWRADSWWFS